MPIIRLVTFDEVYDEPIRPFDDYLSGISRDTLLKIANFLLHTRGLEPFVKTIERIFGHHNVAEATRIVSILREIERQSGAKVAIVGSETAMRVFQLIFPRPDEEQTKTFAAIEIDLFKMFFAINSEIVSSENLSLTNAPDLPGVDRFSALALLNSHSRFDISQDGIERIMISQMAKSIQLFRFMTAHEKYNSLLAAFLEEFFCDTWQEYTQQIFSLTKIIFDLIRDNGPSPIISVKGTADTEESRIFLDKFILADGTQIITDDYFSVRERPLFKLNRDEYVVVYPRFVVEMLHKGLYWRFQKLNEDSQKRLLDGQEWPQLYKKEFSEEYILNPVLDQIFKSRGIAISGKEMEDSHVLDRYNNGEPDYYFRAGKRSILIESKDVNINKVVKRGDDFNGFVEELRGKFYRRSDAPVTNRLNKTAILQLLNNIRRLLSGDPKFDTGYDPSQLIIYPVVVVHDSTFNMPGLNALLNSWFQQELSRLRQEGEIALVGRVRSITVIDIDTLLVFQDYLAKNKHLRILDILEAYSEYGKSGQRGGRVNNREQLIERISRTANSFSNFLYDYAEDRKLKPVSETQTDIIREYIREGKNG